MQEFLKNDFSSSLSVCSYVIRRILRRGIRFLTEKLGAGPGVFASLVHTVVEILVSSFTIQSHT